VALALRSNVRQGDFVGRYGGEEFCVLLPSATLEKTTEVAEALRERIAEIRCGVRVITASFGASSNGCGASKPQELIEQSDKALYFSKRNGRNRVTAWPQVPEGWSAEGEAGREKPA